MRKQTRDRPSFSKTDPLQDRDVHDSKDMLLIHYFTSTAPAPAFTKAPELRLILLHELTQVREDWVLLYRCQ